MNNKGVILSVYVYALLVFFLLVLLSLLTVLNNTKFISNKIRDDAEENIGGENYNFSIELSGDNVYYTEYGQKYNDPGFTATDENGNPLPVSVSSNLDIWKSGEYEVKYTVKYNNIEKTIIRKVIVKPIKVNAPALAQGMTPIKWNGTSWVNTSSDDLSWYDYSIGNWANAKTKDGSMWVWIPRYVYKITSGWHSNTTGTIDVKFSDGTDDTIGGTVTLDTGTTSSASNNKWTNHPGFKFGTTELTGIWVAKFEPTATEGVANGYTSDSSCPTVGDDVTTKTIKVIPNVTSWRCITEDNAFLAVRNMETKSVYGWGVASTLNADGTYATDTNNVDTHLIKNVEWGAVAYLSKSTFGKNKDEVWINNNQNYVTGCAGNTVSEAGYNGCQNTYESANGIKASTTGTIYGIYDMSGGAWEKTSAYVNNGNTNLATYGPSIVSANSKYKDVYTVGTTDVPADNYAVAINKKGEAIYETSNNVTGSYSWFVDYSYMPSYNGPWLVRGGPWDSAINGGMLSFSRVSGVSGSYYGFRPVLLVGTGL